MNRLLFILILLFSLFSCSHQKELAFRNGFPAHWWAAPEKKNPAKWWEITPDKAQNGEVILSKRNELGIFSNFAESHFTFKGRKFKSIEGLWQSMKYPENKNDPRYHAKGAKWAYTRKEVEQMVSFKAKKAGDLGSKVMKSLGINWVSFQGKMMTYRTAKKGKHYKLIKKAMAEKLKANKEMQKLLLSTGDLVLKPDHIIKGRVPPAWKYYDIYMEFRDRLRKGEELLP